MNKDKEICQKSGEYEVMTLAPPGAGYPIEPFEWGLSAVQIWCF